MEERQSFTDCAEQVEQVLSISTDQLNAYLRGVLEALACDAKGAGKLVRNSQVLWYIVREGSPRLRVYYTLENGTCWLTWVEVDSEWAAANL